MAENGQTWRIVKTYEDFDELNQNLFRILGKYNFIIIYKNIQSLEKKYDKS